MKTKPEIAYTTLEGIHCPVTSAAQGSRLERSSSVIRRAGQNAQRPTVPRSRQTPDGRHSAQSTAREISNPLSTAQTISAARRVSPENIGTHNPASKSSTHRDPHPLRNRSTKPNPRPFPITGGAPPESRSFCEFGRDTLNRPKESHHARQRVPDPSARLHPR